MQRLANNLLDLQFVRTLWEDQLPKNIRYALAATRYLTDEQAAAAADEMWIIEKAVQPQVFASSAEPSALAQPQISASSLQQTTQIDQLVKMVTELSTQVKKLQARSSSYDLSPGRRSPSPHPRRVSRNEEGKSSSHAESSQDSCTKLCWYHNEFGTSAQTCEKPCSWTSS